MTPLEKVRSLPIWQGDVRAAPLGGGITNINFLVEDGLRRAVVRIGDDIPVHQIMRFNELAASRAAARAGVSPEVIYHEAGALVIDYIEGRTMTAADLRQDHLLDQALDLVARAHRDISGAPRYCSGFFRCCATIRIPCMKMKAGICRCFRGFWPRPANLRLPSGRRSWSLATTIFCPPTFFTMAQGCG